MYELINEVESILDEIEEKLIPLRGQYSKGLEMYEDGLLELKECKKEQRRNPGWPIRF